MGNETTSVVAASSPRFNFFLIGGRQALQAPADIQAKVEKAFNATQFPRIAKSSRWRNYSALKPRERRTVRRRFEHGDPLQSIASSVAVYAGDIACAAETERWKRGGKPTFAKRIVALSIAEPCVTNREIADRVGCSASHVRFIREGLATDGGAA